MIVACGCAGVSVCMPLRRQRSSACRATPGKSSEIGTPQFLNQEGGGRFYFIQPLALHGGAPVNDKTQIQRETLKPHFGWRPYIHQQIQQLRKIQCGNCLARTHYINV
jgi:hypothetical protein